MTDKAIVKIIHTCLKDRSKWFIDFYCPDIPELQELCEKAKESADNEISRLSILALYARYQKWYKEKPIVTDKDGWFGTFLNQVVFDLGKHSLRGNDRTLFEDSCYLTFHFIN